MRNIKKELNRLADTKKAKILSSFFKTKKGEYGEGDVFIGVSVPDQRSIAKKYIDISLSELEKLLYSKIHEHRLTALLILVEKFKKEKKHSYVSFYSKHIDMVNNWDLVDLSSHKIPGEWILMNPTKRHFDYLYKLAKSKSIWKRRIALVSLFAFLRDERIKEMISMCQFLLKDKHDLIRKALGWMLREVGKVNKGELKRFLDKNIKEMSRTTLRYAIERFPEKERRIYLLK